MKTIISNKAIHDIMKNLISWYLEESGSLIKYGETTKNEANEKQGGFAPVWDYIKQFSH